jgi:hypothetical protein
MKHIVQLGVAGFGNRISVLGYCLDLAIAHDCTIEPRWYDNTWREGFERYFQLRSERLCWSGNSLELLGSIYPPELKDSFQPGSKVKLGPKAIHRLERSGAFKVESALAANADTFVVCKYLADYSDAIFDILALQPIVIDHLSLVLDKFKPPFDCWHIRNTDKTGQPWQEVLLQIQSRVALKPQILITDSFQVKIQAQAAGIYCNSAIPEVTRAGIGVHHLNQGDLEKFGLTKDLLNLNLISDLFLAGVAEEFLETCPNSSFSRFVTRARSVGWFRRHLP